MPRDIVPSVCPHDCPSVCALEIERLDERTIGRVHGAAYGYTAGVVCAKVARYAERQHHPDRLGTPLRRVGAKGEGRFLPLSWDDALDEVAEQFARAAQRLGAETVWPFFYAGTMGLVQRDGVERLRHIMRYSRQHSTYCNTLADAGWRAGAGAKRGVDAREIPSADLVIMWGGNPVATQVNLMSWISRARKERGAPFVVIDPYRTPTAEVADIHLMPRPGTDGALACAAMHVLFKEGFATAPTWKNTPRARTRSKRISPRAIPPGPRRSPASRRTTSTRFRAPLRPHQAQLYPHRLWVFAQPQRRGAAFRRELPARRDGRLAV